MRTFIYLQLLERYLNAGPFRTFSRSKYRTVMSNFTKKLPLSGIYIARGWDISGMKILQPTTKWASRSHQNNPPPLPAGAIPVFCQSNIVFESHYNLKAHLSYLLSGMSFMHVIPELTFVQRKTGTITEGDEYPQPGSKQFYSNSVPFET